MIKPKKSLLRFYSSWICTYFVGLNFLYKNTKKKASPVNIINIPRTINNHPHQGMEKFEDGVEGATQEPPSPIQGAHSPFPLEKKNETKEIYKNWVNSLETYNFTCGEGLHQQGRGHEN